MFQELFAVNSDTVKPEQREQLAVVLQTRAEYQRASADLNELRARYWAGDRGLDTIIDLKKSELVGLHQKMSETTLALLKENVDLDQLKGLLPTIMMGVLQCLDLPLPVLMEVLGLDLDTATGMAEKLKEYVIGGLNSAD